MLPKRRYMWNYCRLQITVVVCDEMLFLDLGSVMRQKYGAYTLFGFRLFGSLEVGGI